MTEYIKPTDVKAKLTSLRVDYNDVIDKFNALLGALNVMGGQLSALENQVRTDTVDVPDAPSTPPAPTSAVTNGKTVAFGAGFDSAADWVIGQTSAYPPKGTKQWQTNPTDNKLDRIAFGALASTPASMADGGWRFNAAKAGDGSGQWWCDLATTEGSPNGFKAQVGDELSATVTLYDQQGAWPAIWTWRNGDAEVDCFEYHGDNPFLLELSNHAAGNTGAYYKYADNLIQPGQPFELVCKFKSTGVEWWVGGRLVFTGTGVPAGWQAFLIVNLSVCAGKYHPAPAAGSTSLYWDIKDLKVWR